MMSDKLLEEILNIKAMLITHTATTKQQFDYLEKIVGVHSDELWGKNGNPGLVKHMDRQIEREKQSLFWRAAIATPVIGYVAEKLYQIFNHTSKIS
jgi:hypothetical protein